MDEKRGDTMTKLHDRFLALELPDYMLTGTLRYFRDHQRAGGFLTALCENDLMRAVALADTANGKALSQWVQVLYNYCPSRSYGSPEAVAAWITGGNNAR